MSVETAIKRPPWRNDDTISSNEFRWPFLCPFSEPQCFSSLSADPNLWMILQRYSQRFISHIKCILKVCVGHHGIGEHIVKVRNINTASHHFTDSLLMRNQ